MIERGAVTLCCLWRGRCRDAPFGVETAEAPVDPTPRLRLPMRTRVHAPPRPARARAPRPAATQGRALPRREPVLVPRGGWGPRVPAWHTGGASA